MDQPQNQKLLAIIGLVVIVAAVGVGLAVNAKNQQTASATLAPSAVATNQVASTTATPAVESANTSQYKDGTYSATGSYESPGGQESIEISVTVKNGVITATSAQEAATDHDSEEYQQRFIANYKSLVVGKSLDSVSLGRVSGASLTGAGFNDAISQIKTQARA
ncbi:MAG TPA: calcium-binding protein [Candidatus Saccharimonadia bacterium]